MKKLFKYRVKEGERYYYIEDCGTVDSDIFEDYTWHLERLKFGNFFETHEACEEAISKIKELLKNFD